MTNTKANEAAAKLITSVQDTNKAIADSTVTTLERNLSFAQNVLENGVEVLKSHAESSRSLMQEFVEQARNRQVGPGALKSLVDSTIAAQERNTKLAQSILENGVEVLKSQASVAQSLVQDLGQQFQIQQDAFQVLARESMDAYKDFVFAPLTFWQQAMNTAEAATVEGYQNFQKATQQGMDVMQKTAHQAASMTNQAVRHTQSAGKKTAE